jgi:hypothetical protein
MKLLFGFGLAVLVIGLFSLILPIPHTERHVFTAGGASVSIQTKHSERASPLVSAVLIAGGLGMMVAGRLGAGRA